ncbi:hypothetical protein C8R42DRAFT_668654 [Lentinula raphanica]|nr:hypothetical protein C8R42DRAFT_668654 [Lentinula raphanica]
MSNSFEYYLVAAFSDRPFGGNPAIVAFLDPTNTPESILCDVASTFKQPMTVFLSEDPCSPADEATKRFLVRYFTAEEETPLCVHATLAAAHVIFRTKRTVEGPEIESLEFVTRTHGVIVARRVDSEYSRWMEIEIDAGDVTEVSNSERERIVGIMNDAFGKTLSVQHVAKGTGKYEHCLVVEVDEKDDIKNCQVTGGRLGKETGYLINAITARSSGRNEHFASRVFVPFDSLGGEDHVCGSAHAVLGPYWTSRQALLDGEEIRAIHVGRRGGDLRLFWTRGQPRIRIRGEAVTIANGVFSF